MANPVLQLNQLPSSGRGGQFISHQKPPFALGNQAVLTCGVGFKVPIQSNTATVVSVQGQLVWDPDHIDCEPFSNLTVLPQTGAGGTLTSNHLPPYNYGDVVTLSCERGYTLPNQITATVLMQNNQLHWSQSDMNCIPVRCGQPSIPQNGSVSNRDFYFPKSFHYECNHGYELNMPQVEYECSQQGTWTPPVPRHVHCDPVGGNVVQKPPTNAGSVLPSSTQPSSSSKPPSPSLPVHTNPIGFLTRILGNNVLFSVLIGLMVLIVLGITSYCIYVYKRMYK